MPAHPTQRTRPAPSRFLLPHLHARGHHRHGQRGQLVARPRRRGHRQGGQHADVHPLAWGHGAALFAAGPRHRLRAEPAVEVEVDAVGQRVFLRVGQGVGRSQGGRKGEGLVGVGVGVVGGWWGAAGEEALRVHGVAGGAVALGEWGVACCSGTARWMQHVTQGLKLEQCGTMQVRTLISRATPPAKQPQNK